MTTAYFRKCILNTVFKANSDYTLPSAYYVGLSSTPPLATGEGVTEPFDEAYQRVLLDSTELLEDTLTISNSNILEFPMSTEDWGTMTHYVIFDQQEGGHLLMSKKLTGDRIVQGNTQVWFRPQALHITMDTDE